MTSIKLSFGLRENSLIHIGEVDSGLACDCTCPHCHAPLVAKKGKQNEHHFAHYKTPPCAYALETALHLAAKEILDRERAIKLPAVQVQFNSNRQPEVLAPAQHYLIDALRIEQREAGLIPDLIATCHGRDLWIEIYVTHRVDRAKKRRIRQLNVSAIEIDLSKTPRNLPLGQLADTLIHDIENKRWLHNARAEATRLRMIFQARRLPTTRRGLALHVDHCPIQARTYRGKSYANVIDNCAGCIHCLEFLGQRAILCNGHLPKS